jgi:hypothetical protein
MYAKTSLGRELVPCLPLDLVPQMLVKADSPASQSVDVAWL